jgi:UDP-N-acetylmuramoyl-tripeptide--D-alanyl-D-alanine ligase
MTVAIENFIQIQGLNKIMILGDMFELGSESKKEHQQIVDSLLNVKSVQCFLLVLYSSRVSNPQFQFYESFDSLLVYLEA